MDQREIKHDWWERFDEKQMVLVVMKDDEDECYIPAEWSVCGVCNGRGVHVNPSIDSHGIGSEEFAEDLDFAAAYHRGVYDQPCVSCRGRRVMPVVAEDASDEHKALAAKTSVDFYEGQVEDWHAREMGY